LELLRVERVLSSGDEEVEDVEDGEVNWLECSGSILYRLDGEE
jgi:hypothetical protein